MPQRQQCKNNCGDGDGHFAGWRKPAANAVSFIEINKFHKAPKGAKPAPEDHESRPVFKKETPISTEVARDVTDKAGEDEQYRIAIEPRKDCVQEIPRTTALGHFRHLYWKLPDVPFHPSREIERGS